jgi:hypothetical protein
VSGFEDGVREDLMDEAYTPEQLLAIGVAKLVDILEEIRGDVKTQASQAEELVASLDVRLERLDHHMRMMESSLNQWRPER